MAWDIKYKPSKYKYVCIFIKGNGDILYSINLPKCTMKFYPTEREAAIAVDKILISRGKKPLNILVKKD